MIDTLDELESVCKILVKESIIGIDTEFDWRKTYYPTLCLIQISTKNDIYLVDPLKIESLVALKPVLENKKCIKVLHSPEHDLKILHHHTTANIENVFDTQLAAEFLGFSFQPSLNDLVSWLISKELDKSVKLSDWTLRPLGKKQIKYAKEDVQFLISIHHTLTERLKQKKRLTWYYDEVIQRFSKYFYQPSDTHDAYLKLKKYKAYKNRELLYLIQLAKWRLETAKKLNLPIRRVISDDAIYQIASKPPKTINKLSDRMYHLHKKQVERYADEILKIIQTTDDQLALGKLKIPQLIKNQNNLIDETLFKEVYEFFKNLCDEKEIISQMVATRLELKQFLSNPSDKKHKLNNSWRHSLIGKTVKNKWNSLI
ncbi:HRDC domain-containing protein [Thiotrichales bacterium 19S9-12]|nr:HRDC domain-containing protein [Thiotrichales bacterium 19S9-11]MCF6811223.1 HRDC domain-containing protein [Thiotrichales bacterium 19S9-12]